MGGEHLALGARGEVLAAKHLKKVGYRILARNYRCRYGEIDLIAEECGSLVSTASRSSPAFGHPLEAVDAHKRGQLTKAARHYLEATGNTERFCRFDVVAVAVGAELQLEVVRNAFELEEGQ